MLNMILLTYGLAVLSGILIGSISMPMVTSRSIMFALTMLHSILGGAILGIYLNIVSGMSIPVPVTATLTAIGLSILAAELIERGFAEDVAIALSVSIATTITIVFSFLAAYLSSTAIAEAWLYIAGTSAIATIDDFSRILTASIIVIPLIHMISRELKYIAFDEDGAKALGLSVRFYRYLFYSLIALAASILSSTIGVLVTHVIMAVPGAVALRFSKRGSPSISYLTAIGLMVVGYLFARVINIPPSGGVGIFSAMLILVMMAWRRHA